MCFSEQSGRREDGKKGFSYTNTNTFCVEFCWLWSIVEISVQHFTAIYVQYLQEGSFRQSDEQSVKRFFFLMNVASSTLRCGEGAGLKPCQ